MDEIGKFIDGSRDLTHPERAMRVLLECGHLRLIPYVRTIQGIGSVTSCGVCPKKEDGHYVTRMVVEVSETGEPWFQSMALK